MTEMGDILGRLFAHAEQIIAALSEETGKFNSQAFVRKVMQDQQMAYIDLLSYFRTHETPFQQAHQEIGTELRNRALALGYVQLPGKVEETSIFLTRTQATVYRRQR
ncbi:MAG: hypothetical protein JXN59_06805 [Anaerolineae bacterium]|nr:hypothetical protein [Anaerolineae bacterium]